MLYDSTIMIIENRKITIPLAERLRPQQLGDVMGQQHILGAVGDKSQ